MSTELTRNVLQCARAAHLAYFEGDALAAESVAAGFTMVAELCRGSNHAIILDRDATTRIIAFRGTDEGRDWRTNMRVISQRMPWGRVHRGFHSATLSFWPELGQYVQEGNASDRTLWITGHSLGGAIALLAAAKVSEESTVLLAGLYTFGQPPVGVRSFCTQCDQVFRDKYIRVVNHTDAVSALPSPLFRRVHAGRLWYFDVRGHLHTKPTFRRRLADGMMAPRLFGGLSQFSAHAMEGYVTLIERVLAE